MTRDSLIRRHVRDWALSGLGSSEIEPWHMVGHLQELIRSALARLTGDYAARDDFAIHASATIEDGVILKGVGIIGPRCNVAAGAYLRGGVMLGEECTVGPSSELKSSVLLSRSKLAHLNFVGDSIIGSDVNIEAGVVVANHRNELEDKAIRIEHDDQVIETGVVKFGALIGDDTRIGANAVIAPGAILAAGSRIGRLELVDQSPKQPSAPVRAERGRSH